MQKGFMAISTVLLLSVVILAIVTTVTLVSIGELQASFSLFRGEEAIDFTEGCVEDYLLKIRADSAFSGGAITRPEGTCTIVITSANPNWDITVSSSATNYQRKVQVVFTRNSTGIVLISWKEI